MANREGEREYSSLTHVHICHRPRIPFRHVLIERSCAKKHCKKREKGAKQRKERPNPTTQTQHQQGPVSNHKKKNKTCETCDPTNLSRVVVYMYTCTCIQQHTTTEGAVWPQRGNDRVNLLCAILVTADTSQAPITPYGWPVVSFEAANFGQDPSAVSPKHPPMQENTYAPDGPLRVQVPTAAFKAALSAGANTAPTTSTINNVAANKNHTIKVHERRPPPVRVLPHLLALSTDVILGPAKALVIVWTVFLAPSS